MRCLRSDGKSDPPVSRGVYEPPKPSPLPSAAHASCLLLPLLAAAESLALLELRPLSSWRRTCST